MKKIQIFLQWILSTVRFLVEKRLMPGSIWIKGQLNQEVQNNNYLVKNYYESSSDFLYHIWSYYFSRST